MNSLRTLVSQKKNRFIDEEFNLDLGPATSRLPFEQDAEGAACKLYGLPLVLDALRPVQDLLGKPLTLTVRVTDEDGDVGVGVRLVTLSADVQ